jgi:hypothetical protein
MQQQPSNSIPIDLRYIYTSIEIEDLVLTCTKYAQAELEDGLDNCISKVEILQNVDLQVKRILRENLQKKEDCKEVTTFSCSLLDARTQMYQVDPINEVLNAHYEIIFMRFLLNELVVSDDKFINILNDESFTKARQFAAEKMKLKFPLVNAVPNEIIEKGKQEIVDDQVKK